MNVAVLSLTRDRLEYTQHCFASLREYAGCFYDHYVLDQASRDGTWEWLNGYLECAVTGTNENMGIAAGMNELLENLQEREYDVIVKFDNDCELTQPDTLRTVCELALEGNAILSPRILGLNNPPPVVGEFEIAGEAILEIPQIGGIFMAVPARFYDGFRYNEGGILHSLEDVDICWAFRAQGGRCGYVKRFEANHFETTSGQHARYPEYFARTLAEGKPRL